MANPEDITVDDKANQWDRIVTADDSTEIANKAKVTVAPQPYFSPAHSNVNASGVVATINALAPR